MSKKEKRDSLSKNGKDARRYQISKHRGMLAADVERKNATCHHILEHRAMLSVGASKEEGQHYITFVEMRECSQQMFKRKNAARCPPINAPGSFLEHFGSLSDVILSPGGGRGGL